MGPMKFIGGTVKTVCQCLPSVYGCKYAVLNAQFLNLDFEEKMPHAHKYLRSINVQALVSNYATSRDETIIMLLLS